MRTSRLTDIYNLRFRKLSAPNSASSRSNAWEALYTKVLRKYIKPEMTILDLGSGPGYFCNRVDAQKVIAVDLDKNNSKFLNSNIIFQSTYSQDLTFQGTGTVDLIFSSNLFEHLGSAENLLETLKEAERVLKKNNESRIVILMPNIRYVKWDFYNFIDHNLPLNESSLSEALEICGFEVIESYKKFFPYSADGIQITIPTILINWYLILPPRFRPLAKQMFFVAKPINHTK